MSATSKARRYSGEDLLARASHMACQWEDNNPPQREQEVIDMLTQAGTDLLRTPTQSPAIDLLRECVRNMRGQDCKVAKLVGLPIGAGLWNKAIADAEAFLASPNAWTDRRLVPVQPTQTQISAARAVPILYELENEVETTGCVSDSEATAIYKAMVGAAPK